jgi:hypothetical protein
VALRQSQHQPTKYRQRIEITDSFCNIASGSGGDCEDRGYARYAGI